MLTAAVYPLPLFSVKNNICQLPKKIQQILKSDYICCIIGIEKGATDRRLARVGWQR